MKRILLPIALSLLVASCGSQAWELSYADSGSQVNIRTGDRLEIMLESNPSTGYGWEFAIVPEMLALESDEFIEPDTDLVGAPGTRALVMEATGPGAGVLRLEYIRALDEPPVPERVAEYVVVVDDAPWPPEPTGPPPGTSSATAP